MMEVIELFMVEIEIHHTMPGKQVKVREVMEVKKAIKITTLVMIMMLF